MEYKTGMTEVEGPHHKMSQPNHYRMRLNNLLQGTGRLRWGEPIKSGPDHSPDWTIHVFLDGEEFSHTAKSLGAAKEEAARKVLRQLGVPDC